MPAKVIALVFTHDGNNVYHTDSSTDAKRLLRKGNKILSEHYGRRVGTVWGDLRGKTPDGTPVPGYALCMETPKDEVPWLLETFWGAGANEYTEMAPGVGYTNKNKGRVRFFALDVSQGDDAINAFLKDLTGQPLSVPKAVVKDVKPEVIEEATLDANNDADPEDVGFSCETHADDPELNSLTKADLQGLCDGRDITYRKKDTKAQLISLLS